MKDVLAFSVRVSYDCCRLVAVSASGRAIMVMLSSFLMLLIAFLIQLSQGIMLRFSVWRVFPLSSHWDTSDL